MERITRQNLEDRAANVNRRIASTGHRVIVEGRNGYIALDEYRLGCSRLGETQGSLICLRTLTVGTKREVGDFLHAMMVGIDLFNL